MRKDLLKESLIYILIGVILGVFGLIVFVLKPFFEIRIILLSLGFLLIGLILIILGLFKKKIIRYKPLRRQIV